jgi:hypothetical protein
VLVIADSVFVGTMNGHDVTYCGGYKFGSRIFFNANGMGEHGNLAVSRAEG